MNTSVTTAARELWPSYDPIHPIYKHMSPPINRNPKQHFKKIFTNKASSEAPNKKKQRAKKKTPYKD